MKKVFYLSFLVMFFVGCDTSTEEEQTQEETIEEFVITADQFHEANVALEQAIINDYFSPPVASRMYLYPNLAAYECLSIKHTGQTRFLEFSLEAESVNYELASVFAFYYTAMEMVYSSDIVEESFAKWESSLAGNVSKEMLENSRLFGKGVAEKVMAVAGEDYYAESRSDKQYELIEGVDKWKPTPPDYMGALEPNWEYIVSVSLDSANQFRCVPPTPFSLEESSQFYMELMEVYDAVNMLKEDETAMAKFWDCNPIVPQHQGHVTFAEKKLTPGGHWLSIAREAMETNNYDFTECVKTYAYVSIGVFDAFISCWEAKYHYNYIRPVTVIQENFDQDWSPILLTPNFPEYPSGHSVVSGSASIILTNIIGENYHFVDSSEVPFGMQPRTFDSFIEASEEAAISRLHGGIHFMPAISNGLNQGREVGKHVVQKFIENAPF